MEQKAQLSASISLTQMMFGFQLPRAVMVAARLGLGKLIGEQPKSAVEIADSLNLDARTLHRLLRFLSAHGVFKEQEDGLFCQTELSANLHFADAILWGEEGWRTWDALPEALRTGQPTFEFANGAPFFEYASNHPEQERNWNDWNTATGESWLPPVVDALHLQGTETIVDVGGGLGNLLIEILSRYSCRGILFDLPEVVKAAQHRLRNAGVLDRCQLIPGDAFREVPAGGDIYTVCRVLLNWSDDHVIRLLTNCCRASKSKASIFVVDLLLPDREDPLRPSLTRSDLNLFLAQGGGHRTTEEIKDLLEKSGLELVQITTTANPTGLHWQVIKSLPIQI